MRSTPIRAIDFIFIAAPAAAVWDVLTGVAEYPKWWPKSLGLRVRSAPKEAIGAEMEIRPFGGRLFRCRVEDVDAMTRIRVRYFGGLIEGIGEWRLETVDQGTRVSYHLDVVAFGRLVAFLAGVFDLAHFHSRPMRRVLENLRNITLD